MKKIKFVWATVCIIAISGITTIGVVSCSSTSKVEPSSVDNGTSDSDNNTENNINVQNNASSIANAINESPLLSNYILTGLLNDESIIFSNNNEYVASESQGNINLIIASEVSNAISYFEIRSDNLTFSSQISPSNINVLNATLGNTITFDLEYNNQSASVNLTNNISYVTNTLYQYLDNSSNTQAIVTSLIQNDMISYTNNAWSIVGGEDDASWIGSWFNSSYDILDDAFPSIPGWFLIAPTVDTEDGMQILLLSPNVQIQGTNLTFDFSYLGVSSPDSVNINLSGYQSEATN